MEKIDFQSPMLHFLLPHHYVNSKNTIFSFENVDFWPKIFLISCPFLESPTTHITMLIKDELDENSMDF